MSESPLTIHDIRETFFFSEVASDDTARKGSPIGGELKQWIDLDLSTEGWRTALDIDISSGNLSQRTQAVVFGGKRRTLRCYAPALWPGKPDPRATLTIIAEGKRIQRQIAIGTHRPWTVYLMSDLCADDTWAYSNLEKHDRDDYLTTRSELALGNRNAYNFAASNQADRFLSQATPQEKASLMKAVIEKWLYITPVPDQLLCGIFNLSSYPTILDPYRHMMNRIAADSASSRYAYHMESPTWSNGFANLLASCGFQVLGKSLLRYQAPWIAKLDALPRIVRLKTAPQKYIYLVLGRHGYDEGSPILSGVQETTRYLHEDVIPQHHQLRDAYPTSAVGLIGMYSDLRPDSPEWGVIKCKSVEDYNSQGWDYPKLVNGNWHHFGDHLIGDLGPPDHPRTKSLLTVQGDIGSSWEVWTLAAQRELAQFRRAQRSVVSLSTLHALKPVSRHNGAIDEINQELAYLGDHAWNGSHRESKVLNLRIRRRRLRVIASNSKKIREHYARGSDPSFAAINTLGWDRLCTIPVKMARRKMLLDRKTGETYGPKTTVPIPGFGYRVLEIVNGTSATQTTDERDALRYPTKNLKPALDIEGMRIDGTGGWDADRGSWSLGPFAISARLAPDTGVADCVLDVTVRGRPPENPYDLRWIFILPWKRCTWRGESGGGFITPGPVESGGDSLMGIRGSIFSAGEGIAAKSSRGDKRIEFAFDQTGMCGLGGKTTATALGTYNEKMSTAQVRATVMKTTSTPGILEWYLLSTGQNPDEALIHQGGAQSWNYRCALRSTRGGFDDAALFRFAAGFNTPAEIGSPKSQGFAAERFLSVDGDREVLALSLRRHGKDLELNLYNTADRVKKVSLSGQLLANKTVTVADMLGNQRIAATENRVSIPGKSYIKAVIHE